MFVARIDTERIKEMDNYNGMEGGSVIHLFFVEY